MKMRTKIVKLTVTDEFGVEHTWEGEVGYVAVRSINKIGKPYQQQVIASMTLPPVPISVNN